MNGPNFYNVNIDQPLSLVLGSTGRAWEDSVLGRLNAANDQVYLKELSILHRGAEFAWRIVDAFWSDEDGIITAFRAYTLDGQLVPEAAFGVTWDSCPYAISLAGFAYQPPQGNKYYVPVENRFTTPNTGGYTVQVLDRNWPSEAMAFGIRKGGKVSHQALVISWRLMPLGPGYPQG